MVGCLSGRGGRSCRARAVWVAEGLRRLRGRWVRRGRGGRDIIVIVAHRELARRFIYRSKEICICSTRCAESWWFVTGRLWCSRPSIPTEFQQCNGLREIDNAELIAGAAQVYKARITRGRGRSMMPWGSQSRSSGGCFSADSTLCFERIGNERRT
jgi:hypothetical protein